MSYVNKIQKSGVNYDIQDARIPQAAVADADKVIKVDSTGAYVLGTGGGGAGGSSIYEHFVPLLGEVDPETSEAPVVVVYFTNAYPGLYKDPSSGENMFDDLMKDLTNDATASIGGLSKVGAYAAKGTYIVDAETGDGHLEMRTAYYPLLGGDLHTDPETGNPVLLYAISGADQDDQGNVNPVIITGQMQVLDILDGSEEVLGERFDPSHFPPQYKPEEEPEQEEGE